MGRSLLPGSELNLRSWYTETSTMKRQVAVVPFTFFVGHFSFVWVGEDIFSGLQKTSPIVLGSILVHKAKFSILWVDQSEMSNLLIDL